MGKAYAVFGPLTAAAGRGQEDQHAVLGGAPAASGGGRVGEEVDRGARQRRREALRGRAFRFDRLRPGRPTRGGCFAPETRLPPIAPLIADFLRRLQPTGR